MVKKLTFYLLISLILSCDNPKEVNYSFFVAGHTYGKPGRTELGLCNQFKDKFNLINERQNIKFGVLTGDVVRHASAKSWDAIDSELKGLNVPIYFSRGNHDGGISFIEKRYGKTYKSYKTGNDLHIILDSNIANWNIEGEQLLFLKNTLKSNLDVANVFIYVHHIIWWNKTEFRAPYMNSRDKMSDDLTFWSELYPILKNTGKPVFLFAGDVGAHYNPKRIDYQSYSYVKKDNLTLITSGMGGGKTDNFIIANVLNNNEVSFELIHLNGNNINGLGKLEDYKN